MSSSPNTFVIVAALAAAALALGCSSSTSDTPTRTDGGADSTSTTDGATAGDTTPSEGGTTEDPLDICLAACDTDHQAGTAKFAPINTCGQTNCADACGGGEDGGVGGDGGAGDAGSCPAVGPSSTQFTFGDPTCDACLASQCCTEVTGCISDAPCLALNQCIDKCYVDNQP